MVVLSLFERLGGRCRQALHYLHHLFWGCLWPSKGGFSFHMHLPYFHGTMEVLILIKLGISTMRTQYRVSHLRISLIDIVVHVLLRS